MFKTPKFWQGNNIISCALMPISWLYWVGHNVRWVTTKPYKSSLPILCIGGVVAGGSGKTPVLEAILKIISQNQLFQKPVVLMRGYGGSIKTPIVVNPNIHTPQDVGDEALIHAQYANVIVAKNRVDGAMLAEVMGANIIIMDDGFQNNSIEKDLSFLVIDSAQGTGNGHLIPAGPMREPYDSALKKCTAIIETNGQDIKNSIKTQLKIISTHDKTKPYFAFAGLGRPEKFRNTLNDNGFNVVGFKDFPDHHPYCDKDIKGLIDLAKGCQLITTQKDFIKIPDEFKTCIDVLMIEILFDDENEVLKHIQGLSS